MRFFHGMRILALVFVGALVPLSGCGSGSAISGNGGARTSSRADAVSVTTDSTAPFSVTVPATTTVEQGKSGSSTVTTKGSIGFDGVLQLRVSKKPNGVMASLNPTTIPAPGSGTSKLTLTVANSVQTGSYPVTVAASDGTVSESATLTLKVARNSNDPNATFKGCWYKHDGHSYQGLDVYAGDPGSYPFNAILYYGTTCNSNDFADQIGFGQLIYFGDEFGWTFWFSAFADQTDMSARWYVGDENKCVSYAAAPDC